MTMMYVERLITVILHWCTYIMTLLLGLFGPKVADTGPAVVRCRMFSGYAHYMSPFYAVDPAGLVPRCQVATEPRQNQRLAASDNKLWL